MSAPEVFAEDPDAGLLLLEDLGDGTYTRMLADGADPEPLYAAAVDVLIHIHDRAPEAAMPSACRLWTWASSMRHSPFSRAPSNQRRAS